MTAARYNRPLTESQSDVLKLAVPAQDISAAVALHTPDIQVSDEHILGNGLSRSESPPVSAVVEAQHFETLCSQLILLVEANERMARLMRKQLFSHGLFVSFVRGMALGLGWVVGTTLVVGVLVYFLQSFDTAPWLGQYISRIIEYLNMRR